jgi:hypothetical protein
MEMILVLTLRGPYRRGVEWPMMLMAISASVIQAAGLIPPYFELAKRNGRVIGINFWFLTIDYAGAFFSLMAVVAQQWFDALGSSIFIACIFLETGIFASQAIWLYRVRHVRREAKKAGMSYNKYVAAHPSKGLSRSESSETVVDVEACHDSATTNMSQKHMDAGWGEKQDNDVESGRTTLETARQEPSTVQQPPPAVIRS